jgi:diguanylate cyclase (GGDEF)-like protein
MAEWACENIARLAHNGHPARGRQTMTNKQILDGVAEATAQRDRARLAQAVARLLQQFLDVRSVELYRTLRGEAAAQVVRHDLLRDGRPETPVATAGAVATAVEFPAIQDWAVGVSGQEIRQQPGPDGSVLTAFAVEAERGEVGRVMIVNTPLPLSSREAQLARGVLRIMENHLRLLDYGERDTLTGLLNRKTFETQFNSLGNQLEGTVSAPLHAYLGLVDVDHFKSVNDVYGHLFGDEVLLLIGQQLQRKLRAADYLYRFGGEEFLVMVHGQQESEAEQAFERLRLAIEAFEFPQVGRVTISLGWTSVTPKDTSTSCVERADAALYYGKKHGRNQVVRFEAVAQADTVSGEARGYDAELF